MYVRGLVCRQTGDVKSSHAKKCTHFHLLICPKLEPVQMMVPKQKQQQKGQKWYLYLLEQILELNQKLFGLFGFVRDAVEGLGELALRRHTPAK